MFSGATFFDGRVNFTQGDMLDVLRRYPSNHFDSCVCDPPYHLTSIVKRFGGDNAAPAKHGTDGAFARASKGFMGKSWDGGDVAFRVETWAEVFRVLKPGAYVVAFSASRTYHRMACAIEDAGFITHPMFGWIYATGFPKAHDLSKQMAREEIGDAEAWQGWAYGAQSTKPALEPVYFGQKPFSEKTGAQNVLRWGVGAVNIDGCRIETDELITNHSRSADSAISKGIYGDSSAQETHQTPGQSLGRWPANLIHDGSDEVIAEFPQSNGQQGYVGPEHGVRDSVNVYGDYGERPPAPPRNDKGSAARFFYSAKVSPTERAGSKHPTIKPLSLIRYLCRFVTPPNGLVLDPFAGSGTTGEAAALEGFRAELIDLDDETARDLAARESR